MLSLPSSAMSVVRSSFALPRSIWLAAGVAFLGIAAAAQGQVFDFTINPATSGLNSSLSVNVPTSGTLIGNWDAAKNSTGTRTKPGIFGTFGPTENVAVPMSMGVGFGGPVNSSTSGLFQLSLDPANASAQISGYSANLLQSGNIALPITLSLLFESFRTRSPDSTFIGGIPLPIPLGEASLTQLSILQVGGGQGSIKKTGPNQYDFLITLIVALTAEFTALGQPFSIPGAPTAFPLEGSLTVTGTTAVLTSMRLFDFNEQQPVNQPLPQFPFELPTILPTGGTAELLMNLDIGTVTAGFSGTATTNATGLLIPAPGAMAVLLLGGLTAIRRRR